MNPAWFSLAVTVLLAALLIYDKIKGTGQSWAKIENAQVEILDELSALEEGQKAAATGVGKLRDEVRDLSHEFKGVTGTNGWKGRLTDVQRELHEIKADLGPRVHELETWKVRDDAITEAERQLMKDVGRSPERLRDELTAEVERDPNYRYRHSKEK